MGKHMHVCAHAHVIADVEIQGQLTGVSFLLPGDWTQFVSLGRKAPFPSKPSCQPALCFYQAVNIAISLRLNSLNIHPWHSRLHSGGPQTDVIATLAVREDALLFPTALLPAPVIQQAAVTFCAWGGCGVLCDALNQTNHCSHVSGSVGCWDVGWESCSNRLEVTPHLVLFLRLTEYV